MAAVARFMREAPLWGPYAWYTVILRKIVKLATSAMT